jgi:predicted adenylyl cyclase CyaB
MRKRIEVEYKFEIKKKLAKKVIRLLDETANEKMPREYQNNIMFDNHAGLMKITNGRIRVRTLDRQGGKTLTYKKPISPENGAKREIEYEVKFFDPRNQIEKILKAMEFSPSTSYERYQTKWIIGGVVVSLDEYPYTNFLEIEGPMKKIEVLVRKLGFTPKKGLTKPVDTLFREWRKKRNLPDRPYMRFSDFNK